MVNKLKEQMKDIKLLVLNIVIIILAVFLVIILRLTIEEVYSTFTNYEVKENSFIYALEDENYGRMVESYYQNCGSSRKEDRELQEYYDVAKYYEAAFYYKVYAEAGDVERAQIQKTAMEEAAAQMGEFAFVKEKINEKLGLEQ